MNSNNSSDTIKNIIRNRSKELGIDAISFGSVSRYDDLNKNKSNSPLKYFINSKSIISAAISYRYDWNLTESNTSGYIAHYTTANFYKMLSDKLKILAKDVKKKIDPKKNNSDFYKIFVNSKINDKLCAYYSGLGYIARNSLIMISCYAVSVVIGEILIDLEFDDDEIVNDLCQNCHACVNACPTGALSGYGILDKSKCIQHLTTSLNIPKRINDRSFLDLWGKRFYGCTECVDACPNNKRVKSCKSADCPGFIGTSFNVDRILELKKGDYKIVFAKNQLSAGWISEYIHVRNALLSAINQEKRYLIKEYKKNIDHFNWDEHEKGAIKNFIKNYLKM